MRTHLTPWSDAHGPTKAALGLFYLLVVQTRAMRKQTTALLIQSKERVGLAPEKPVMPPLPRVQPATDTTPPQVARVIGTVTEETKGT